MIRASYPGCYFAMGAIVGLDVYSHTHRIGEGSIKIIHQQLRLPGGGVLHGRLADLHESNARLMFLVLLPSYCRSFALVKEYSCSTNGYPPDNARVLAGLNRVILRVATATTILSTKILLSEI
jgi:hypothetical protein